MQLTTIEEAKHALEQASIVEGRLRGTREDYEARIAPIKSEYEGAIHRDEQQLATLRQALLTFIEEHPDYFQKPRKVKTDWGSFGLQAKKQLQITNPDAVIAFARRNGYTDFFEEKVNIRKAAVQSQICEGISVPGAQIVCEENPVLKVVPTLRDATV